MSTSIFSIMPNIVQSYTQRWGAGFRRILVVAIQPVFGSYTKACSDGFSFCTNGSLLILMHCCTALYLTCITRCRDPTHFGGRGGRTQMKNNGTGKKASKELTSSRIWSSSDKSLRSCRCWRRTSRMLLIQRSSILSQRNTLRVLIVVQVMAYK